MKPLLRSSWPAKARDPGEPKTQKALDEVREAGRRQGILEVALSRARAELLAAVDQHRDEEIEKIDEAITRRRAALTKAVDEVAKRRDELAMEMARRAWVEGLPSRTLFNPQSFASRLPSLLGQNGEPMSADQAINALRDLAAPPTPREAPEPQPLQPVSRAA